MDDKEYSLKGIALTDTIIGIKQRIETLLNVAIDAQILIFNGNKLENSYSLDDYSIPYDSVLHLVIKNIIPEEDKQDEEKKEEEIFIRSLTGKIISIPYKSSYTIGYIKSRVQDIEQIGVGRQRFVFKGQELDGFDKKCKEYDIEDGNTLTLILRLRNDDTVNYIEDGDIADEKYEDGEEMILKAMDLSKSDQITEDLFLQSGLGKLTKILQSHLLFMKENEEFVDKLLLNEDEAIKEAKLKAIEEEQEILLSIMMDVLSMSDFIRNIVLCENLLNKLYTKELKIEQQAMRKKYGLNIDNLNVNKNNKIENKNIDSFVKLIFGAQTVHLSKFKKWIDIIIQECDKENIEIIEYSGAQIKKIARAFYKCFYVYKQDGYKSMTDILRCSMVLNSFEDIYKVYNIINNKIEIIRIKDRFEPESVPFGYRDILINFYCPESGDIICELQLHHKIFYKYKKISHDIYKKARLFDYGDLCNYAYSYAQQFARPKIGDIMDITMTNTQNQTDDDLKSDSNDNNDNLIQSNDLEMNGKELLIHWGLNKYIEKMIDVEGWNDPNDWHYLTENDLKNDIGFKDAHFRKFNDKYNEWLERKKNTN